MPCGDRRAGQADLPVLLFLASMVMFAGGAAASGAESAADLLPDGGFETGTYKAVIHWRSSREVAVRQGDAPEGQWVLALPGGDKHACTTPLIPVESGQRYSLRFLAKVDGPGAIGQDMLVDDIGGVERLRRTRGLAGWRLHFRHSDDSERDISRGHPQRHSHIVHHEWTEYREDFYVPAGADRLKISFSNGSAENAVEIDHVRLVPIEDPVLNINPEVDFGPFNFSGYNAAHQTRIVQESDVTYLDTSDGYIIGDPIPVGARRYVLRFRGRQVSSDKRAAARLRFYDGDMEKMDKSFETSSVRMRGTDWDTYEYAFVPPKDAAFVRLIGGGGHFDWFRIEPATDSE